MLSLPNPLISADKLSLFLNEFFQASLGSVGTEGVKPHRY